MNTMDNKNGDTFEIYQVKSGQAFRDYRYENIQGLEVNHLKVELKNYDFVYKEELKAGMGLEDIFIRFNEDRPEDFKGHSLSVSDVIVLNKKGHLSAHYVDSFGFKNIPEFLMDLDKTKKNTFSILKKLDENKKEVSQTDTHSKNKGSMNFHER